MNPKHQINQTVAQLTMSLDTTDEKTVHEDVQEFIKSRLRQDQPTPTGYTTMETRGYWISEELDYTEFDDGLRIEVWTDGEKELEAVKELRDQLEEVHNQDCICLTIKEETQEHTDWNEM